MGDRRSRSGRREPALKGSVPQEEERGMMTLGITRGTVRIACVAALTTCVAILGLLFAASSGRAATACSSYDTVRVGYQPVTTYQPPLIAASMGIMKKYCIKIENV